MELLKLRYFLTAAEYQHMTKAAEHLQIAQPALSQAIHRLEAELGVPLFERKNRSIELNEAGRLLQKRLIPIVSALDRIPGELRADQYMSSHTIHLKLLAASTLITNRIIAYRALRPDVNFQLYQAEKHADYDLCVFAVRSDLKNTDYEDYMVMLEEDLYLAIVGRGILQVANNRVTMIVDTAERPEDIDEVRAREALERAQEQLRQKQSLREFKMSQASMARALTRLKGSHLKELK